MIKNIVFDLGNVLMEYNPQKYLESAELQALSGKLGNAIQQYADVLEKELKTTSFVGVCTF